MLNNSVIQRAYNNEAASYAAWMQEWNYEAYDRLAKNIKDAVGMRSFSHAIDAAVGSGLMSRALKGCFSDVVTHGYDISEEMLKLSEDGRDVDFLYHCDLDMRWPNENDVADIVLCSGALELVGSLSHFLSEASRALKQGGVLAVTHAISGYSLSGLMKMHSMDVFQKSVERVGFSVRSHESAFGLRNEHGDIQYGYMVAELL